MFARSCTRRSVKACEVLQKCVHPSRSNHTTTRTATSRQSTSPKNGVVIGGAAMLLLFWQYQLSKPLYAEQPAKDEPPEVLFEKPRRSAKSKQENRDIISSQHLQVKRSWENPGLYAWGSNTGRVAAPDSEEKFIKTARRIASFDGVLLRDVKLDRKFGAAITKDGDLLQWGIGYQANCRTPVTTLKGKNLVSITLSRDRVIGLSKDGTVYSIPVQASEQEEGAKPTESSWIPFLSSTSPISYRKLEPQGLNYGEKVSSVAAGLAHVLMLTSKGRVFSAAAATEEFPRHGQLGIPGLTWQTRPSGSYDQCHEITTLRGFNVIKIAAGDFHSLVADTDGRVFTFGDNSSGQLGFPFNAETSVVDVPSLLPIQKLYSGSSQVPKVTGVEAGGSNSYFTVDATQVASQNEDASIIAKLGRVTADTWSCGSGIFGTLGNGRWTHTQATPTKIPALSGLYEYDEINNKTVPIRLSRLSVGQNHVSAVMDNIAHVDVDLNEKGGENDVNWGADILFFGNNEFYQLGTGKRNNSNTPIYIQPLDQTAERKIRGKEEHRFQITPLKRVKVNGSWVNLEQRVECGRGITAVYSGV